MIKTYNKLVRDRIPEIIEASGRTCVTEILSDEDYLRMVDAKLDEELAEYHKDQNIEELADLMEVIHAAAIARGYTLEELEQVRAEKAEKRGGFAKKILLKEVVEERAMDDLMARTMVENLALGINPLTGKVLSKRDVCSNEMVQDVLQTVLKHCTLESYASQQHRERMERKEKERLVQSQRASKSVSNAKEGLPWTYMDDRQLETLVAKRYTIEKIVKKVHRSPEAIQSRMIMLNLKSKK